MERRVPDRSKYESVIEVEMNCYGVSENKQIPLGRKIRIGFMKEWHLDWILNNKYDLSRGRGLPTIA